MRPLAIAVFAAVALLATSRPVREADPMPTDDTDAPAPDGDPRTIEGIADDYARDYAID